MYLFQFDQYKLSRNMGYICILLNIFLYIIIKKSPVKHFSNYFQQLINQNLIFYSIFISTTFKK